MHLTPELEQKRDALYEGLRSLGRVLVAYSGGVDSAYLAFAAHEVLGNDMIAVLADSPSLARSQMLDAIAFAEEQHIPLKVVQTSELEKPDYQRNDAMRCFHCKDELFTTMEQYRAEQGFHSVAYGVNKDDQGDFRPGQQAARGHGVAAPLLDAGMTKQDIRELARVAGLRVWEKPASACLSSRIEYGRAVTREALEQIERGEDALKALGFRQFRVRHHGEIARLEIAREEMARLWEDGRAETIAERLGELGFIHVTLDLRGFRSGSLNEALLRLRARRAAGG